MAAATTSRGYGYRGYRSDERVEGKMDGEGNLVSETPHGTVNGYVNYRCRCGQCRAAWTAYSAERRKKK